MKMRYNFVLALLICLTAAYSGAQGLKYVGLLKGDTSGDRFGTIIAPAGDINGNGYTDFLVGAPGSYQSTNYKGKVLVFFGGKEPTAPDMVIEGENPGDRFGASLTTLGDINGDGFDDFAIGADKADEGGSDAGKVYIYFGGKQISGQPDITLVGERPNDWFGTSIAGGQDMNGDQIPDFVVGASYGGKNYTGVVYVFLGGSVITQPAVKIEGETSGDSFGERMAILGDIDGDGISEFAVSSYYHNSDGNKNSGRVYIYRGGSVISREPWHTLSGSRPQANFGFSIAPAGDVNKDGTPDFIVGAPGDGPNSEGVAYLYQGGPVIRDPIATFYGEHPKDLYGYAVCGAGDINKNGYSDVLIGSPFADIGNYRSGRVEVFYGTDKFDTINDFHINGNEADAQCGTSIAYIPRSLPGKRGMFLVGAPGPLGNGRISYLYIYK